MIREFKGKTFTTVEFDDYELSTLDREISQYLKEYPPAGYATTFETEPTRQPDGSYHAALRRYTSCE